MVRTPSSLGRWVASTVILGALIANAGCVGVGKQFILPLVGTAAPGHMEVIWSKEVQYVADPLHVGSLNAALVARMYLFGNDQLGAPITGSGKIVVDLYDDLSNDGSGPKHKEQTIFPVEIMPKLATRDQLGAAYLLCIPCPPDVQQVRLSVKFEPATGGEPLVRSSSSLLLDRGQAAAHANGAIRK